MRWLQTTIGLVCLPTEQRDPSDNGQGTFRYVDIAGIDRESKAISRAETIPCSDAPSRARKVIRRGDILVSTVRPNLNAVAQVPDELDDAIASTGFAVLRTKPDVVESRFFFYWTQHQEFINFLTIRATGASYPAVSDGIVRSALLPLPPPSEQRRIVEILDEANRLRKLRREADAKAARVLPALFLKMFGDPATNPKGWKELPLREVIKSVDAGWSAVSEARAREEFDYGVLKVSAVTSGRFLPEEHKAVKESAIDKPLVVPRRGDLLFSRANTRELVAASCVVEEDHPRLFLPDKLWRITPKSGQATSIFLRELFWQSGIRNRFRASASGSSGSMLNIGQEAMLRTLSPIPPIELQEDFSALAWKLTDSASSRRVVAKKIEALWENVMNRVFSGELTGKWREANVRELLAEMEQQAKLLNLSPPNVERLAAKA